MRLNMNGPEEIDEITAQSEIQLAAKKLYRKPEFRFERVFETRALSCGKLSTTQGQCAHNLKSS
jgi:hypothetical protein